LLNQRAFELDVKLKIAPHFLQEEMPFEWGGIYELKAGGTELRFAAGPDPEMDLAVLPLDENTLFDGAKEAVLAAFGGERQRIAAGQEFQPGKLCTLSFHVEGGHFLLNVETQGRYGLFTQHHPEEFEMKLLYDSKILSPVQEQEFPHSHTHDDSVSSVGIDVVGECDPDRLDRWLGDILRDKGENIFRMKGVLAIKGQPVRFVFQGVHMLFDGQPDRRWKTGEARRNQLIFIGRNLDRVELNAGFKACLA
jgi:hypothetical protein